MKPETHGLHLRVDFAHQHLNRANDALQEALQASGNVDGIILLELIGWLANLRLDVANLAYAIKKDGEA